MSSILKPVFSNNFLTAGIGPVPIIDGSTPVSAYPINFAIGFKPFSSALFFSIKTKAAAPSFIPDAFPAVTDPSFLNAGLNLAMLSISQSKRMCSSCSKTVTPFRVFISIGKI